MLSRRRGAGARTVDYTTNNTTEPQAFTALIDVSDMMVQDQCPLFNTIPSEIRTRIFELACTESDNLAAPFKPGRVYFRPDYKYRQKADIALLQTCKRIFNETRFMPVSEVWHRFWFFGGPYGARNRKYVIADFGAWQKVLNKEQQAAVEYVHLSTQQCYLEDIGNRMLLELRFKTNTFKLTFRHSDWWSWESPPESTDRLGICPWLPERVSHQAMLSQPLEPTIQQLRATMIKGTWGYQIGLIEGLEVLRVEFETDVAKKDQMQLVLARAKHWKFPLDDNSAVLESDGQIKEFEWIGQVHMGQDSTAALRNVGSYLGTEAAVPMRTYFVAEMTWKRRKLRLEEMA